LNPYAKVSRRRELLAKQSHAKKVAENAAKKKESTKAKPFSTGKAKAKTALKKRLSKERTKFYKTFLSK